MASPNDSSGYQGKFTQLTGYGEYNSLDFMIRQILARKHVAKLVLVIECSNAGQISPVGTVTVRPLVNALDGDGNPVPHGQLFNIPYHRLQGGQNAVVIDPTPGDIGLAVFADEDISTVKATRKQANPGSSRKASLADGVYLGGYLNGAPTQYIQFSASGITISSTSNVNINAAGTATVTAPNVAVNASSDVTVTAPTTTFNGNVVITGTLSA